MPAMRNKLTQGVWGKLLSLSVTLTLLSGSASAQITPGVNTPLQKEQKNSRQKNKNIRRNSTRITMRRRRRFPIRGRPTPGAAFGQRRPPRASLRMEA